MEEFCGFSMEVFDLWMKICFGNETRPEVIKEKYKAYITEPLEKLYDKLLPSVRNISDDFDLTPHRCISSPYTDMRFSRGQKYKDYMYLRFKQRGKESDIYGLYFVWALNFIRMALEFISRQAKECKQLEKKFSIIQIIFQG